MKFNKVLFDCSSLPALMAVHKTCKGLTEKQQTELEYLQQRPTPTDAQKIKIGALLEKQSNTGKLDVLSVGCISSLKNVYVKEKYYKQIISITKDYSPAILNGVISEPKSLELVSEITGMKYTLHKKRVSNKYLKGILDAYAGESVKKATTVIEIKTCANLQSFMGLIGNQDEETKSSFYWQIMGYLAITGASEGHICHCIVSYPDNIINDEINRFIFKARAFGMDGDYIQSGIDRIRFNLTFDEIPIHERMIRFSVQRDEEAIKSIYEKVSYCRKWLNNFDKIHTNMNL
jgi:hypothetical protein